MTTLTNTAARRRDPRRGRAIWEEQPTPLGQTGKGVTLFIVVAIIVVPLYSVIITSFSTQASISEAGGLVLVLNPAVVGASAIGEAGEPLLDGFRAILPNSDVAAILSAFALIGLFASLQGIMYAYGRNIYSLSRAGYYPKALSLTGTRKTPWIALVAGAVIGIIALILVDTGGETAGAIVLNIAVWGAVLAYLLQMVSFVLLRRKFPNAARPYRSPFGVGGAVFAGAIAALIFVGVMLNEDYREAIVAIAGIYVVALVGFAVFGRHRLVLSPEEEFALTQGERGVPEVSYSTSAADQEAILEGRTTHEPPPPTP